MRDPHERSLPVRALCAVVGGLWPPLLAAMLVSCAVVPSNLDPAAPALSLAPALAFYRWGKSAPAALVCPFAALAGAALDILAHGPLGYWALVYAAAAALGGHGRDAAGGGVIVFVLHMAALAGLQAVVGAAATLAPPDWHAILRQTLAACAIFPVIMVMIPASPHRTAQARVWR